jgi:PTS system cellobiose-specific IIA component
MEQEWEQRLFTLILHAGEARTKAKEAGEAAKEGDWESAERLLEEANDEQILAHKKSAEVIKMEAKGEDVKFSVLLVHALDLLILAWVEIDYAEQFIDLQRRVQKLEEAVGV